MSFPDSLLKKCWILAGPTASGKTAVSLQLARMIDAEIIALDSMTLYRGMDIGTAKPSVIERNETPHHLIDVIDPHQEFSLAEYLDEAKRVCQEIVSRRRTPLFVGGAGLYLRGLLRGVFEGPSADWSIRSRLEECEQQYGPGSLHQRLSQVDPVSANRLHPNDQRRIIRALEVFELLGKPLSSLQQNGPRPEDQRPQAVFWLSPRRDWLYQRIDIRVEQMFRDGLISEVSQLIARPEPISHTARQGLGYKEVIDWLEVTSLSGESNGTDVAGQSLSKSPTSIQEVMSIIQTRTRQFAKRQHTWFRNLEECHAVPIDGTESPATIAQKLIQTSRLF